MTTMQIDRAVVEQALEALDEADTFHRNLPDQRARRLAAMAALRTALAESERDWSLLEATQASLREHMAEIRRLRAALAQQAEPVEPVAWERRAGGLKPLTQRQYDAQTVATKRHYTRIAPPQRKLVLLTAQELDGVIERHVGGSEITDDMYTSMEQFARAIEKTSWEKNHG